MTLDKLYDILKLEVNLMEKRSNSAIERLQNNLNTLRRICGWSTQELGDKIGVTKQTISNLEKHKTEMSKLQYLGLCCIFMYEIGSNLEDGPKASFLQAAINKLLDEDLSGEELEKYENNLRRVATLVQGGEKIEDVASVVGCDDLLRNNFVKRLREHQNHTMSPHLNTMNDIASTSEASAAMLAASAVGVARNSALGGAIPAIAGGIATVLARDIYDWTSKIVDDKDKSSKRDPSAETLKSLCDIPALDKNM